jgi:hypothetical protein
LCLGIPREAQARRFIVVSLVFDLLGGALGCFSLAGYFAEEEMVLAHLGEFIAQFISWTFFMVFLVELARFVGERVEVEVGMHLLKFWITLFTLAAMIGGTILRLADILRFLLVLSIPLAIYFLYLLIKFLLDVLALIGTLRQEIRSRD